MRNWNCLLMLGTFSRLPRGDEFSLEDHEGKSECDYCGCRLVEDKQDYWGVTLLV